MADRTEKILLQLELDTNQVLTNLQKTVGQISIFKKEQSDLNKELKAMKEAGQEGTAEFDNLQRQLFNVNTNVKFLTQEQKNYEKQLVLNLQANKAEEGSYEQLLRQYQQASIALKTQEGLLQKNADGTTQLTDAYKLASANVEKMKSTIIAFDQGIKDGRTNVGNYKSAVDAAFKDFSASQEEVANLKLQIKELNDAFVDGQGDREEFNKQLAELTDQLKQNEAASEDAGKKLNELKALTAVSGNEFKSLREQIKQAKDEATRMAAQFGEDSSQAIAAQKNVANLTEELDDFNKRVQALNPEAKFKSLTQVAAGAAGAVGLITSGMGLLGAESSETAKDLLKVQQFMQFTQSLNTITELPDAIKNMRIAWVASTTATKANTIAQAENTVSSEVNSAAQLELSAAQKIATTSTGTLTVAMGLLASPIGLVAIGIAAVVAAFKIYDSVAASAVEKTEALVTASDASLAAAEHTAEVRAESIKKEQEAISQKLALMQAEQQGDSEILKFKKQANTYIQNLQDDAITANKNNIAVLQDLEQRSINASRKAKNDDEKKTLEDKANALAAQIKVIEKANDDILQEQKKSDNQILVEQTNLIEKQKQLAEQTAGVRIGLIKNEQQREVAAEIQANKERIRQLEKDEVGNAELILALRAASAQKIKDINQKFALQEVQERNQIEIASTIEGTSERLQVEITAETRLRDEKLKDTRLTETAKQVIVAESSAKLGKLRDDELQLEADKNRAALKLAQDRRDAELQLQEASVVPEDREGKFLIELQKTNVTMQKQIEETNLIRTEELNKEKSFTDRQIEQLQFSEEFKKKTIEEKTEEVSVIIEEGRKKQEDINVKYDTLNLATTQKAAQDVTEITRRAEEERLSLIVESKQLALDAANPEEQFQAQVDLLDAQHDAEVQAAINSVGTVQQREEAIFNLNKKFANAKKQLDEQVNQNYLNGASSTLATAANLFKKQTFAYKALASAQTIIDTYTSATAAFKAMAGIPYVGPALGAIAAGVAIASGLANLSQINAVQFYHGGFSDQGGYTGDGNPRSESRAVGSKPYIYHKREHITPHFVLETPRGKELVNELEAIRLNMKYTPTVSKLDAQYVRSYSSGGFSDPTIIIQQGGNGLSADDVRGMVEATTVKIMENFPPIVTYIQDVKEVEGIVNKVEQRGNW
jgi:hypothetical protein